MRREGRAPVAARQKPESDHFVIYGQDVRYAARGQDARSRDGQDVRYAARGQEARSRPVCGERVRLQDVGVGGGLQTSRRQLHPCRRASPRARARKV